MSGAIPVPPMYNGTCSSVLSFTYTFPLEIHSKMLYMFTKPNSSLFVLHVGKYLPFLYIAQLYIINIYFFPTLHLLSSLSIPCSIETW